MAQYNASVKASQVAGGTKLGGDVLSGKVRYMMSTYTVGAGTLLVGDTINWGTLPKKARLLGHMTKIYWSTGAASSTLNLGDSASAARYLAATSVTTAGGAICEAANASGATFATAAATDLVSTVAGAALPANQVITLHVAYVQD